MYVRCARVAYTTKLGGKIHKPVGPYYSTGQGKGILSQGFWSGTVFSMAKGLVRVRSVRVRFPRMTSPVDKSNRAFTFKLPRRVERRMEGNKICCARCRERSRIHRQVCRARLPDKESPDTARLPPWLWISTSLNPSPLDVQLFALAFRATPSDGGMASHPSSLRLLLPLELSNEQHP